MKYSIVVLLLSCAIPLLEAGECVSERSPESPEIYYLHINSNIKYRFATTVVTSRVVNPANLSQEVFFYMNLPETAFITSFVMEIDGKEYEAYVKEKEEAKKAYEHAVQSGLSAGHVAVSSRDSNKFKISVNVESMAKVKFVLTYEELLQRTLGSYKQVINLNPGQTVRDLKVEVNISESSEIKRLFVPEIKVTNEIEDNEKENKRVEITRPNKKQAIVKYKPSVEDQVHDGGKCFEGQFIIEYDVDRKETCGQVLVDEGYFVHFFAPEGLKPLRKLVVFVLDLSGSMFGQKLVQLKQAMSTILDELGEDDFFSIVEFSYSVTVHNLDSPTGSAVISPESWYEEQETKLPTSLDVQQAYPGTEDYVNKAKQIITKMSAGGGTNINDALKTAIRVSQKALEKIKNEKDVIIEPLIVFLTDGEPTVGITNLMSIQSMVKKHNVPRTSLFSLGFGFGADMNFLKKLSLGNAGFARTIYEASDAALQLKNFYKQISSPLLSNVTFTYLPGQVVNGSVTKKYFHTLFDGSELIVAGKLAENTAEVNTHVDSVSRNGTDQCQLQTVDKTPTSKDNDEVINSQVKPILPPKEKEDKKFGEMERLWAYLTIKQLLDNREINDDDSHGEKSDELKEKALNLALKYKFVTPLTSLVVVKPNNSEATNLESSQVQLGYQESHKIVGGGGPVYAMSAAMPSGPGPVPLHFGLSYAASANLFYPRAPVMRPGAPGSFHSTHHLMATTTRFYSTTTPSVERMDAEEDEVHTSQNHESGYTLSDIEWLKQDDNETVSIPTGNSSSLYSILHDPANTTYQECKTTHNEVGKCTHLVNCILPQFTSSFQEYLAFFCPITGGFAGVCCPNNSNSSKIDSATTTTFSSETTTLAD